MNKKIVTLASALVLSTAIASTASARDGFYIGVRGGQASQDATSVDDTAVDKSAFDFDDVWFVSGALGYRYSFFRAEVEYTYRDDYSKRKPFLSSYTDNSLESSSLMLNGYIDFLPNYVVSPYISGGIGYSKVKVSSQEGNSAKYDWDETNFTWSAGGGLTVRLNRCLNFDAGYRYLDMGELKKATISAHEYYAGLRYTF